MEHTRIRAVVVGCLLASIGGACGTTANAVSDAGVVAPDAEVRDVSAGSDANGDSDASTDGSADAALAALADAIGQSCSPFVRSPGPNGCANPLLCVYVASSVDGGGCTSGCSGDGECADSGGVFDGVCQFEKQGEGFVIPRFCSLSTDH